MSALTREQIARWKHDGFLSPLQLLNTTELQECRDGLERFEQWPGSPVNEISASEDLKWRTIVLRKNQRHAISRESTVAHAIAGTSEYSWCRPPNTDFERTATPPRRGREFDGFAIVTTVFGGPSTSGPKLLCGRPPL